MIKIGVFYDGNYFQQISNYYAYGHPIKKRLSISGLHEFIRRQVSEEEGVDRRLCQIVDAHYFRGRLNAHEASQRGDTLYRDRVFDDILMSKGVTTHYFPMKVNAEGYRQEKNIDVWLALEAFELAFHKRYDVLVLIAPGSDYVPLVRKLNTLGTRVMITGWNFEYTTDTGQKLVTATSQDLMEESSYPVQMHLLIDDGLRDNDEYINGLFVNGDTKRTTPAAVEPIVDGDEMISEVLNIKSGYGFIRYPPNNLFFHYSNIIEGDFNELKIGDVVKFNVEKTPEGQEVAKNIRLTEISV